MDIGVHVMDARTPLLQNLKNAVDDLSFSDFKAKWKTYFQEGYSTTFAIGNIEEQHSIKFYNLMNDVFPSSISQKESVTYEKHPIMLKGGNYLIRQKSTKYMDANSAIINYY